MTATRIATSRGATHSCRRRHASPLRRTAASQGRRPDRFVEVRRVDPGPRRTSAATYRRRRAVAGVVLAAIVALTIAAGLDVLAGSGGDPASAAPSQPAHAPLTVIAQPGDNLWSIAAVHHGDGSITRYLDTLVDLNGGPTIEVGQTVLLP
jgi:nucleoid-associated protein YgaU